MSKAQDVSAKLGTLLLRGYKMLNDACPKCNTVLMQDKKGVKICVNCQQEGANATSSMETEDPQQIVGHKLPERGYSDEFPYEPKIETSGLSRQLVQVLLADIQVVGESLKRNPLKFVGPEELNSRMLEVKYIQECAATIKSLHDIGL